MTAGTASESDRTAAARTIVERRSERELVVERTFAAPARLVFEAATKPELVKRWWAPRSLGVVMYSCEADVRVGGRYRYVFGRDGEPKMAFSGTYTEVTPYTRVVMTQVFEQMADAGEAVITATFVEHGGTTRMTLHQLFPSKQALDGAIASGMERGMRESHGQLDELARSLAR